VVALGGVEGITGALLAEAVRALSEKSTEDSLRAPVAAIGGATS
jgi:hypothetical protein